MTENKVDNAIEKLLTMLDGDDILPLVAQHTIRKATGQETIPSDKWSLSNTLLMYLAGTIDARGYKQWGEVGRHVRKGAKAFHILAPCIRKIEDRATGELFPTVTGFRGIAVFRVEDTEGEPIEYPDYTPPAPPPLADRAAEWGLTVSYAPFAKRYLGYYSPSREEIRLFTHDARTFFHELAHAAHGKVRKLKPGSDPTQEIVAEFTAAVLAEMYFPGNGEHGNSLKYIRSHTREKSPKQQTRTVIKLLSDIEKCLALITC